MRTCWKNNRIARAITEKHKVGSKIPTTNNITRLFIKADRSAIPLLPPIKRNRPNTLSIYRRALGTFFCCWCAYQGILSYIFKSVAYHDAMTGRVNWLTEQVILLRLTLLDDGGFKRLHVSCCHSLAQLCMHIVIGRLCCAVRIKQQRLVLSP